MADIRLMKYKIGDKVKIRTWVEMEKEFGVKGRYVECCCNFTDEMEIELDNLNINRLLTIESIVANETYRMIEMINWEWSDDMIERLALINEEVYGPVENRWQILDL